MALMCCYDIHSADTCCLLPPTDKKDVQAKLQIVTEIRDNIEMVHSPEYGNFLKYLFPMFFNVLRQEEPQFDGLNQEQKIRNTILERY